eukprot:gene342-625_t
MATNVMWPIENDDRRVHIMKVSSRFNRNYDFFNELCKSMNEGGREYLMHVLQNRNIADFIPQKMPEDAEALNDVRFEAKLANFTFIELWCYTNLCGPIWPFCSNDFLDTATIFNTFKEEMIGHDIQKLAEISRMGFTKKLKEIFMTSLGTKKSSGNKLLVRFESLQVCRLDFQKYIRCASVDWDV